MDIRLIWERLYWALVKRFLKLYDLYSDKDVELHRIINTSNNNLGCHG